MKKYLSLFFIVVFGLLTAHAKNNYNPGYIITNNKDTIKGFIDCGTANQNARFCHFKAVLTDTVQTFLPDQIVSYQFTSNGKSTYFSKSVKINGTTQTVFLESLVQGTMNLYCFTEESNAKKNPLYFFENRNGETNFISKTPDEFIKIHKGYFRKKTDNKYKGYLHFIFRDFEMIGKKAHNTEYKRKDLIGLTNDYNKIVRASEDDYFELKYERFIKSDYSVYAEKEISIVTGNDYYKYPGTDLTLSAIGAQINLSIPRWIKSLSIQTDLGMRKNASVLVQPVNGYPMVYMRPNFYLLSLGLGAKYTYQKGLIRPSIEAGIRSMYPTNPQIWGNYVRFEYFMALGINPPIGRNHFLLFNVGLKLNDVGCFSVEPRGNEIFMGAWTLKLGYTF